MLNSLGFFSSVTINIMLYFTVLLFIYFFFATYFLLLLHYLFISYLFLYFAAFRCSRPEPRAKRKRA